MSHKVDSFHTLFLFLVKMRTNQSYLFLLLLASLSTSCTSDCPNPEPYWHVKRYHECAKLYIMLETALLANPENLYQLQDSFFPSSSSEPIYAGVTFTLNEHHHHSTCWTSSVLLKSLDPTVLTFLQTEFLNVLFELEDPSNPSNGLMYFFDVQLFFNLTVNSTVSDYSRYIITSTLQELTSWVSILDHLVFMATKQSSYHSRLTCSQPPLLQNLNTVNLKAERAWYRFSYE